MEQNFVHTSKHENKKLEEKKGEFTKTERTFKDVSSQDSENERYSQEVTACESKTESIFS